MTRFKFKTDAPIYMDDLEYVYLLEILKRVDGNRAKAANLIGRSTRWIYYKLAKYNNGYGD